MTKGRIIRATESVVGGTVLPIIGYISIGEKATNKTGKEHPVSLNYFRVRGKNGTTCQYEKQFYDALGERPTKIPIAFISDDVSEVCNNIFQCYIKGKYWGSGDGETFRVFDPQSDPKKPVSDRYVTVGKDHPLVTSLRGSWKERLDMTFVIPAIKGVMGVWKFSTGGVKTTIPEIVKTFDFVRQQAGTIRMFPFDLVVEENTGHTPDEIRQWKSIKLVPSFGESSIMEIKSWLQGGHNLEQLGIFTLNKDEPVKQLSAQPEQTRKEIESSKNTTELFPEDEH